jgi:hypothetical protein
MRFLALIDDITSFNVIILFYLFVSTSYSFHSMGIKLLLTFILRLHWISSNLLIFSAYIVGVVRIVAYRKTAVVLMNSTDSSASDYLFRIIVLILSKRFNFFLFLAILLMILISLCFRLIIGFSSVLADYIKYFFILQIQNHQFSYNYFILNYLLVS